MDGELESRWTEVAGRRLHARVADRLAPASAPDVVLVHGLGVSGRYLLPLARRLAPFCRVYVPDLPGFGLSDRPRRTLDVAELAGSLLAWLDASGLARPSFYANSLGTQICADLAVRHPQRVDRLILQGPTIDPAARSMFVQAFRLGLCALYESPTLWLLVLHDYWTAGPVRVVRTLQHALADRLEEKLPRVQAPTLIVRGENDWIAPRRWCRALAKLAPHGRFVELARESHVPNYSAPGKLVDEVLSFLLDYDFLRVSTNPLDA